MKIATFGLFGSIVLAGCGASDRAEQNPATGKQVRALDSVSPAPDESMAVDAKLTKLTGNPQWALHLTINFNDERLREKHPEFDGLEKIYVDVPNIGRHPLQHLDTGVEGLDSLFSGFLNIHDNDIGPVLDHGIFVGAETNVGEFLMQVSPTVQE